MDLSDGLLESARGRLAELVMDARALDFPEASFVAVYLPLILTAVEDGARVLAEAARSVVVPGAIVSAFRVR